MRRRMRGCHEEEDEGGGRGSMRRRMKGCHEEEDEGVS